MKSYTATKFFFMLAVFDFLLVYAARVVRNLFEITHYNVADFDSWLAVKLLVIVFSVIFVIVVSEFYSSKITRLPVRPNSYFLLISISLVIYILLSFALAGSSRYEEGGLTGISYIFYVFKTFILSFISFSLIINKKARSSRLLLFVFTCTAIVTADGLAVTLFVASLIIIYFNFFKFKYFIPLALVIGVGIWYGINQKFTTLPSYFGFEFFLSWTLSRFSIGTEAFLLYLDGQSVMSEVYFTDYIFTRLDQFIKYLTNGTLGIYQGKSPSVGANVYYDLYGIYKGGASPGLWYSATLLNVIFIIPYLYVLSKFIGNFFRISGYRLGWKNFFFFYILFLPIFSNPINLINLAPNLFFLMGFYFAMLFKLEVEN